MDLGDSESERQVLCMVAPAITISLAGHDIDRAEQDSEAAHGLNVHHALGLETPA